MRHILLGVVLALTACAPATVTVEVTRPVEVEVTRVVEREVTRIAIVTELVPVTSIVERVVTATYTPSPLFTPTQTLTPSRTPTPTKTFTPTPSPNAARTGTAQALARLRRPVGDGFYLVNVDIGPGVWRSSAGSESCYWARTSRTGDILDNHFGLSGGTANIRETDFQFETRNCGRWEFISP